MPSMVFQWLHKAAIYFKDWARFISVSVLVLSRMLLWSLSLSVSVDPPEHLTLWFCFKSFTIHCCCPACLNGRYIEQNMLFHCPASMRNKHDGTWQTISIWQTGFSQTFSPGFPPLLWQWLLPQDYWYLLSSFLCNSFFVFFVLAQYSTFYQCCTFVFFFVRLRCTLLAFQLMQIQKPRWCKRLLRVTGIECLTCVMWVWWFQPF